MTVRAALIVVLLSACGADTEGDGSAGGSGPTLVDPRFDGPHVVVELEAGGSTVDTDGQILITLDAAYGALAVEPGCNRYLGSFTLDDDGAAGFTVAGGTGRACEGGLGDQEKAVLAALAQVDRWEADGEGTRLTGDGTTVVITPA